jgi:hypothetical protein
VVTSVYLKLDHCEGGSQGVCGQSDFPVSLSERERERLNEACGRVGWLVRAGIVIL